MAPFVEDDPTAIPVPPTRPSTPTLEHRLDRIAEAPSRAEPAVPYVETSSLIQAPPAPMTFATNGHSTTNGHENGTEESDQNGSQETTVSFKSCISDLDSTSPALWSVDSASHHTLEFSATFYTTTLVSVLYFKPKHVLWILESSISISGHFFLQVHLSGVSWCYIPSHKVHKGVDLASDFRFCPSSIISALPPCPFSILG